MSAGSLPRGPATPDAANGPPATAAASRLELLAGATLARLHGAGGGDPAGGRVLDAVGRELWRAASEGHACIDVDGDDADALAASPVVDVVPAVAAGVPAGGFVASRPLVLDAGKLYPQRFWAAETRLAAGLLRHAQLAPLVDPARIVAALDQAFGPDSATEPDMQRRAVELGLTRRLLLLSGGPGTGKTTTLARLIDIARRLAPALRIAVAAPTGKAAARAMQAMQAMAATSGPEAGVGQGGAPVRGGLTLHRLLGARGPGRGFAHGPDDPLPYDLVIVDEASMIDLEMADALLAALEPDARLVLAGDRDQLASVEPGAVFGSACQAREGPVADCGVILTRNYRQRDAAQIVAFADAVRSGAAAEGFDWAADGPVVLCGTDDEPPAETIARLSRHVGERLESLWRGIRDASPCTDADALEAFARGVLADHGRLGLLCALREGPLGARRASREIDLVARRALGVADGRAWYAGRLVIVRGNSPEAGLFNGEIGVCLAADGQLVVVFDRGGEALAVPVLQMPSCDDAWALTIHQSQGSEFDTVLLVPAPAGHPLATRESLYTGITRARSRVEIFGGPAAVAWAARHPTRRDGDLARRLAPRVNSNGRTAGASSQ